LANKKVLLNFYEFPTPVYETNIRRPGFQTLNDNYTNYVNTQKTDTKIFNTDMFGNFEYSKLLQNHTETILYEVMIEI
jgi:hypothetical protein